MCSDPPYLESSKDSLAGGNEFDEDRFGDLPDDVQDLEGSELDDGDRVSPILVTLTS